MKDPHWRDKAVCYGHPGADRIFFPHIGTGSASARNRPHLEADAKQICDSCPVKTECLNEALRRDEQHGIFGGLNEIERQQLGRRRA